MSEENQTFGFDRFVYTKDQIQHLALLFLMNGRSTASTLMASECIWHRRDWDQAQFVCEWIDKIRAIQLSVTGSQPDLEGAAEIIADLLWQNLERESASHSVKTAR